MAALAMIGGLGVPELVLILVIVLIIFGAGKLPQIGDALGKGIRNFKKASNSDEEVRDVTPTRHLPKGSHAADEVELEEVEPASPTRRS